jgi:lysophospholipase L1-like esterase
MKVLSRLTVILIAALFIFSPIIASATTDLGWMTDEITLKNGNSGQFQVSCTEETFQLLLWDVTSGVTHRDTKACVTHGDNIDIVYGLSPQSNYRTFETYAVRVSGDQYFRLLKLDYLQLNLVANTDIAYQVVGPYGFRNLKIYHDISEAIVVSRQIDNTIIEYKVDQTRNDQQYDDIGPAQMTNTPDGKYIFIAGGDRLFKLDTSSGQKRIIQLSNPMHKSTSRAGANTDDGRYVFIPYLETIVDTDGACILPDPEWGADAETCPQRNVYSIIEPVAGPGYNTVHAGFSNGGYNLEIFTTQGSYAYRPVNVTLSLPGTDDANRALSYIALGDSYTSGEGDLGKKADGTSYYFTYQDTENACHLSSRAYPFALRNTWGIKSESMHSIACSGALVSKDYNAKAIDYVGQNKELEDKSQDEIKELRKYAFDNYLPGIVPQLEYIKAGHPDVITITGGGNDVGFAKILSYCASDIVEVSVFDYSCEYIEGGILHQVLNDSIDSQFGPTKKLIESIKQASPHSKIYYVGYPSFIAGSEASCALNSGALDGNERDMINGAVKRLNGVLKQAAASESVQFINIESALSGGRLCEGSEYMTGVWDVGLTNIIKHNEISHNAFHPNAKGHEMIAKAILNKVPNLTTPYSPSALDTMVVAPTVMTLPAEILGKNEVSENEVIKAELLPGTLMASSKVVMTAFSDPIDIGVYTANPDGSLSVTVGLKKRLPIGSHLLVLNAKKPDGTDLRLYQFFYVDSDTSHTNSGDSEGAKKGVESNHEVVFTEGNSQNIYALNVNEDMSILNQGEYSLQQDTNIKGSLEDSSDRSELSKERPYSNLISWICLGLGATLIGILLLIYFKYDKA